MAKKRAKPKPPVGGYGTKPTQIRLTKADLHLIDMLAAHYRLPSRAAAMRYAVATQARAVFGDAQVREWIEKNSE